MTVATYGTTPGMQQVNFIPDRLIAGEFPIVTDNGTISTGGIVYRGTLIGQQSLGTLAAVAGGSNHGNGSVGSMSLGNQELAGSYQIVFTGATTFNVIAPNGDELPPGVTGTAYSNAEIGFTVTAGGTAFQAGDTFTLTPGTASGNYVVATAAATDGSQNPSNWAILAENVDTTSGPVSAPIYIAGDFNAAAMTFGAGITAASAKALLRDVSIYLRLTPVAGDPV
jgi:hypothetical protein